VTGSWLGCVAGICPSQEPDIGVSATVATQKRRSSQELVPSWGGVFYHTNYLGSWRGRPSQETFLAEVPSWGRILTGIYSCLGPNNYILGNDYAKPGHGHYIIPLSSRDPPGARKLLHNPATPSKTS
jgi:hypothetical protein